MKKLLLVALFLGTFTLSYAQSKFTEQTLNEIHQIFLDNCVKAVTERTLPSFTMAGNKGDIVDYTTFKSWNVAGAGLSDWAISEVKVLQSGNLAITTGITKHTPKGAKVTFHQRFTEVYEFQNNNWMLAYAHYTDIVP